MKNASIFDSIRDYDDAARRLRDSLSVITDALKSAQEETSDSSELARLEEAEFTEGVLGVLQTLGRSLDYRSKRLRQAFEELSAAFIAAHMKEIDNADIILDDLDYSPKREALELLEID